MAAPSTTPIPRVVSRFIVDYPYCASFLAFFLAEIAWLTYALLTTDAPWPDVLHASAGQEAGVLAAFCVAALLVLPIIVPAVLVVMAAGAALWAVADGLRAAVNPPPHDQHHRNRSREDVSHQPHALPQRGHGRQH